MKIRMFFTRIVVLGVLLLFPITINYMNMNGNNPHDGPNCDLSQSVYYCGCTFWGC